MIEMNREIQNPKERTLHGVKVLVKPYYHGYMCNNHSAQRI